jgi:glyceraldehyde 3-phosphate dehydrogenase
MAAGTKTSPPLKGVMGVLEGEWASSRIVGDPHSSLVDLPLTAVQGGLLSVAAWHDNEMGYSARLAEAAAQVAVPANQRLHV